jgi:hypothetical protein
VGHDLDQGTVTFAALTVGGVLLDVFARPAQPRATGAIHAADDQPHLFRRGRLIDEFAQERRLFAPIEDIPDS